MKGVFLALILAVNGAFGEGIDFKNILDETRIGVFVDQHLNNMPGVYTSILTFHDKGVDYINLNAGYLTQVEGVKEAPLAEIGFRLDNLLSLLRSGSWGQKHTRLSPLPYLEFGPYLSVWFEREDEKIKAHTIYGIGIAGGF